MKTRAVFRIHLKFIPIWRKDKNTRYLRREFSYSKYEQTLVLPDDVKRDAISAKVEHGVLTVELPKIVEEKVKVSRQIDIA